MNDYLHTVDADTLLNTPMPPARFVVEQLLPAGLRILAGAPKTGKSWLALWLCLRVAQGDPLWSFPTHRSTVLYSSRSYKDKKRRERPQSDWLIFKDTHEALVDQETWDIVQEVRSHKRRRTNMDEQDMFSGLVYCADCGKPMVLHRAHTMKPEQNNFTCRTYKKDGAEACTGHYIREVALTEIVLETIRRTAAFARSQPEQFAEYIQQKQSSEVAKEIKLVERELSAMKKRAGELDTVFKRMYEDSALGRVTGEQFRMLSDAYAEEKKQLAEAIPEKTERLEKLRSSVANAKNFIAKAKRFTDMDELTPELLHTFVAKIIVYEKEVKYSKHSPQKARIQFRDFDLNEDREDIPDTNAHVT